jgi:tetratricopeptide (TPR) repeat protein
MAFFRTRTTGALVALLCLIGNPFAAGSRETLIESRTKAYDANFRNDQKALGEAIAELTKLTDHAEVGAFASYYAAWAEWALGASHFASGERSDAIRAGERAVKHARNSVAKRPDLADFHTMLTNALITVVVLDRSQFETFAGEIRNARLKALELGPHNPRVVMMDAGMIFNNPPERGGGLEKGRDRWLEAIKLFELESKMPETDPLLPRWGYALAYGWLADLYLAMKPPQTDAARKAAETALAMRPDFWYVREKVLPKLKHDE